jgi:cell division protein FtsB
MAGPEVALRSIWLSIIPVAIVLSLLVVAVVGDKGIVCAIQSKHEKEELQRQVLSLELANQKLRKDIESLRSDPRYLEAIARKELGMVREDELVYRFTADSKPILTVSDSRSPR